jgi:hypothetical protein
MYGPDTQYAHLINQNTIQYRTWSDRTIIATPRYGSAAAAEEGVAGVTIVVVVSEFSIIASSLMNDLSSRRAEDAGEPLLLLLIIRRSSAGTMNVSTSFQLITIDARTVNNVSKNADGVDVKDDSNDIIDTEAADDTVSELPMKVSLPATSPPPPLGSDRTKFAVTAAVSVASVKGDEDVEEKEDNLVLTSAALITTLDACCITADPE